LADLIEAGGRVYAEALFRAAVDAGRVAEVDRDLSDFFAALAADRAVLGSLLNPRLPQDAKKRVVATLLRDSDPLVRNAMLVLVDNGRLNLLHDVSVAFSELAAEQERILDIEVTTAVPLDEDQTERLSERIQAATGLQARLEPRVDPDIIGGLVLRARGVLLDASVRRELDEIHRALITTPLPVGSEA
jgi:F-type H+-transporting ATPase subunit delta